MKVPALEWQSRPSPLRGSSALPFTWPLPLQPSFLPGATTQQTEDTAPAPAPGIGRFLASPAARFRSVSTVRPSGISLGFALRFVIMSGAVLAQEGVDSALVQA